MEKNFGKNAAKRLSNWNIVMKSIAKETDEVVKIRRVNAFFNKYRYKFDKYNWEEVEYWASFGEFVSKGSGDCEDYALAKYYSLRKLGISENKLKLISGKYAGGGHLALAYYKDSKDPYLLDNNSRYLVRMSKTSKFKPETYFNEKGYGVLNKKISKMRARAEYGLFYEWISKHSNKIVW